MDKLEIIQLIKDTLDSVDVIDVVSPLMVEDMKHCLVIIGKNDDGHFVKKFKISVEEY